MWIGHCLCVGANSVHDYNAEDLGRNWIWLPTSFATLSSQISVVCICVTLGIAILCEFWQKYLGVCIGRCIRRNTLVTQTWQILCWNWHISRWTIGICIPMLALDNLWRDKHFPVVSRENVLIWESCACFSGDTGLARFFTMFTIYFPRKCDVTLWTKMQASWNSRVFQVWCSASRVTTMCTYISFCKIQRGCTMRKTRDATGSDCPRHLLHFAVKFSGITFV